MSVSISVVIPAFNSAKFIGSTLETVLNQSEPPLEIIVVDDGSTDDTNRVVARYDGVQLIRQSNNGPSKARNTGIKAARGDYIAFLDSDDLWVARKLSTQMAAFRSYRDAGFCFSTIWTLREDGADDPPSPPYFPPELTAWLQGKDKKDGAVLGWVYDLLLMANCVDTSSVIVRKDLLLEAGMFEESLTYGEDHDLWLRLARCCPAIFILKPLSRYRLHSSALCGGAAPRRQELFHRTAVEILSKHRDAYPSVRAAKALASRYLGYAVFQLKSGNRNEAAKLASMALKSYPMVRGLSVFIESTFPKIHAVAKRIARPTYLQ